MKNDVWRIVSAIFMLVAGTVLSYLGFFQPPVGEISESVLMFTAQALVYAGSAFGIDLMIDYILCRPPSGKANPKRTWSLRLLRASVDAKIKKRAKQQE